MNEAARRTILVVEDEASFVDALTISLEREGFDVVVARDGGEALRRFAEVDIDLVLLDLMLPVLSGLDVCREIRAGSSVPIIMVTAKSDEIDTVVGLEVGADDYVTKPYRMRELLARIRAALRRHDDHVVPPAAAGRSIEAEVVLSGGDVVVDIERHRIEVRGQVVDAPLKEFELLTALMERAGRVVPRDRLMRLVWGDDYVGDTKTLDVHVKRLRRKIEVDPGRPELITTVRGVGYRFEVSKD